MEYLYPGQTPFDSKSAPSTPQKRRVKKVRIMKGSRSGYSPSRHNSLNHHRKRRYMMNYQPKKKVDYQIGPSRRRRSIFSPPVHRKFNRENYVVKEVRPKKKVNKFTQLFVPDNHYIVPSKTFIAPRKSYRLQMEEERKKEEENETLIKYLEEEFERQERLEEEEKKRNGRRRRNLIGENMRRVKVTRLKMKRNRHLLSNISQRMNFFRRE